MRKEAMLLIVGLSKACTASRAAQHHAYHSTAVDSDSTALAGAESQKTVPHPWCALPVMQEMRFTTKCPTQLQFGK